MLGRFKKLIGERRKMGRTERDFSAREPFLQKWMIDNTWCDVCQKADLGLINPIEYELDGKVFVEGSCRACGGRVISEVSEEDRTDEN